MSGDQFKVTAVLIAGREGGQILCGAVGGQVTEQEEPENRDLFFFSWPCQGTLLFHPHVGRALKWGHIRVWGNSLAVTGQPSMVALGGSHLATSSFIPLLALPLLPRGSSLLLIQERQCFPLVRMGQRGFAQGHRINPSIYSSKHWTAVEPDLAGGEMGHSLLEASCLNQELLYNGVLIRMYLPCLQQGHRGA